MKEYKKEDITITWESEKCIHAAACAKGLPGVFKPQERPWIQVDGASKDEIIEQVKKCPSGALGIKD
ncbi:MAG: (4Fe-4S)-binding protein [Cyclobacteriaceae bacterium]